MLNLALIFVCKLAILQYASGVCHVCNDNGKACISEKEFHLCINGTPNTTMKFSCLGENEICTKNARACMKKTDEAALAACGDTSNCGKCEGAENEGKYTCTSRTTFTMCLDGKLSDIRDTCPSNKMCDIGLAKQGQYPCVPNCRESKIEFCDLYHAIDVPVESTEQPATASPQAETTSTTIATPPTLMPTPNLAQFVCSQQSAAGRYVYPGDTTCQNYINCYWWRGSLQGGTARCPSQLFFNSTTRLCHNIKPVGCV